jgi:uncharacterized protein (TIGR03382 family)
MVARTEIRRGFSQLMRRAASARLHTVVFALGVGAAGCGVEEPALSEVESASTVADYVGSSCSTAVVIGLSKQISDEIACEHPGGLTHFDSSASVKITSSAVLQYLEADAEADLVKAGNASPVQVNSAFRTVVQQYLLYAWYQQGRCGIPIAATPGTSNHESGRAVDLANYSGEIGNMANHGWAHDVAGDAVHFDHNASPDIRGEDIKAFQVLWNRNNPGDQIAEDGAYGPATESRIRQAPATGFAIGPTCAPAGSLVADVVSVDGPDQAAPASKVHYKLTLKNAGAVDWPATTKLQLESGASSQLYDTSWTSKTVITTLGAVIAAGKTGMVELDVTTPATDTQMAVDQKLELNDAGTTFGSIDLAVTVIPGLTNPSSGDGGDTADGSVNGGCSAGGGGAGAGVLLALIALVRRRRAA